MKRLVLMIAVLVSAVYVGCKQGDGDRCQVNEDCESDICNVAKGTCAPAGGEMEEIDAGVPDGPDAAPDAPSDAPGDV
ncbi:MAG TPA: hypothetical protein VFV99_20165 [Kofleriaceae bacterium]|nr:hypothetical protein [Kofleriaceae bacterium]